jgi:hypothetical protein
MPAETEAQSLAKQYKRPEPPVRTSASGLQPADWCEKFHDFAQFSGKGPVRSWCPTMAEPSLLLVQALQVVSVCGAKAVPSVRDPVRMSCSFGVSPRPLTGLPL